MVNYYWLKLQNSVQFNNCTTNRTLVEKYKITYFAEEYNTMNINT